MFCSKCGFNNNDGMSFCGKCGAGLAENRPTNPPCPEQPYYQAPINQAPQAPYYGVPPKKSINRKRNNITQIVIALAVVFSVIAVSVVYSAFRKNSSVGTSNSKDQTSVAAVGDSNSAETESEEIQEKGGAIGDYKVIVTGTRFTQDVGGEKCVVVTYEFTNNSDENAAFMYKISAKPFQSGIELTQPLMIDGINFDDESREIKSGTTLSLDIAYILKDESDIELELDKWISFSEKDKISIVLPYFEISE